MIIDVIIIGSNGLGKEIAVLLGNKFLEKKFRLLGFVDDFKIAGTEINKIKVLGNIDWLLKERPCSNIILGFSDLNSRKSLKYKLSSQLFNFPTIIHPDSILLDPSNIKFGTGCVIFPYSIFTTNISIGDDVIVHVGVRILHDVSINDNCILMPNVLITGGAKVGKNVFIGAGAIGPYFICVLNNTKIESGSVF